MRRQLLSFSALVLVSAVSAAQPPSPDCGTIRRAEILAGVEKAIKDVPSLSGRILVTHCGQTVIDRSTGFLDREVRLPITAQTKFDFGSLTKQFVATAILQLRDERKLSLTDPISRYISKLQRPTGSITIHQLLTHTSGLPLYSGEDYDPRTREAFIQWLRKSKLEARPGARYSYSNPGYSTLALIVEQRSGQSLESFLRSRFFDRLDIRSTGYRAPKPPFAINYFTDGRPDGTPLQKAWDREGPFWNLYGNGGMLSTVSDFRTWFEALYEGKVLSPQSTREMFTAHLLEAKNKTIGIGYGWRIIDDERGRWINHGGSNGETFFADVRHFQRSNSTMILSLNHFDVATVQTLIRAFATAAAPTAKN